MQNTSRLFLIGLVLFGCSACEPTTAAARVTVAGTQTLSAVQMDQYRRDAKATQLAQDATVEARAVAMARTASVFTQTQLAVNQRAVAQSTAAAITQVAVATVAARDATRLAVQDADASATAQAIAQANATATAQAGQQATATASVQGTQTALEMSVRASAAERETLINRWGVVFLAILAAVCIWSLFAVMRLAARRLGVVKYGPNGNPLFVLPNGAVYNPLADKWSDEELPAELKAQLALGFQQVLALQAAHSPHPPVKPEPSTRREWHIGPVGATTERISVDKPTAPTLPPAPPVKQVDAPKEQKPHYMFVQGQSTTEADRELVDLREMIERGALQGFTRQIWLGHKYESGHDGTRERYERLIDILTQAGVLEPSGKTWRMAVPVAQALAALNLEDVTLG